MNEQSKDIFANLNESQIKAIMHNFGPALVVAGPGSGKTRVLTSRVAYLVNYCSVDPYSILCITFTNKAAQEIKSRVSKLLNVETSLPWSGTFHSICARILRKHGFNLGIPPGYVIYDTDDQENVIKGIIKDFGVDPKRFSPRNVLSTISSAKSELVKPEDYESYAHGYYQRTVAKIYPEYQKRLRRNNALDFDDLLMETVNLFEKEQKVLEHYQNLFTYILVDEYQDTNKAQYVLTRYLAAANRNLFVVGDMAQAIYSFRGADYRNILNFQKDYPDCIIYNLEQNYRSTQTILDAAKNIIKNNSSNIPLDLWTQNGEGEKVICYTGLSDKEEALFVVSKINELLEEGVDYKEIAILYRTNAQSRNIEEFLIRASIPYRVVGGLRFYSRKEIKDIISYLRVIHNPKDTVSWERIINVPARGIGQKSAEILKEAGWDLNEIEKKTKLPFASWVEEKEKLSTLELMEQVLDKSGYIKWLDDGSEENMQRIENINELKSVASRFVELTEFLENVALIESFSKPSDDNFNAVTLMTIHASKGLEFPYIFLIGLEEGLFPHSQSMGELYGLEEERRLCYVAITRAMKKVYLTNAYSRLYFGSIQSNIPSRFIGEIPVELVEFTGESIRNRNGAWPKDSQKTDDYLDELEYDRGNFKWE